jgi:hypothetical protein
MTEHNEPSKGATPGPDNGSPTVGDLIRWLTDPLSSANTINIYWRAALLDVLRAHRCFGIHTVSARLVGLPLRFNSGTFEGSIVTEDGVTIAHNIHANIGPAIVNCVNSHDELLSSSERLRSQVEQMRDAIENAYRLIGEISSCHIREDSARDKLSAAYCHLSAGIRAALPERAP